MMLRDLVARELAQGPMHAALVLREAVRQDTASAVDIVDDPDEDMAARVALLLAFALAAQDGMSIPRRVSDVLEDDLLVDAAIASGAEAAITGVLAAARNTDARLQKYLALRLAAAGSTGLHVADLLLSVGDASAAGRAALPALVTGVRAHMEDATLIHALSAIVVDWWRTRPEFGERLCAALPPDVAQVLAQAARRFDRDAAARLEAVR